MINFKKRTETSNSDLTQYFNTFYVKVGAFVPEGTAIPSACDAYAQTRPQP